MTVSTLVEPAFCSIPPFTRTLGPEVAGIAELAGFAPDPEQRLALDAIFALDPRNKAVALEAAVVASRQNIKTGLFKQCALGWLFVTDQQLIVWSAHEFSTSQEAHRDLTELLEGSDVLRKRVKHIHQGHGEEAIELLTGQRVKFKARTKTGGRGLSGDKIVLDEAFALEPKHMGSLFPLLSVRPDPQVVYGSSAGLSTSKVLRSIRDRGRPGGDPRLIYLEWCDDLPGECETPDCDHSITTPGCRLDDERRWERSNTQLGRRMSYEYVRAERRALPPAEFARERLGWWDEPEDDDSSLSLEEWRACLEPGTKPGPVMTFAVDIPPDQSSAAVAVGSRRDDGRVHVEVVASRRGTGWVVGEVVELCRKWNAGAPILDASGPAKALLPAFAEAGLEPVTTNASEMAQACGAFYANVVDLRIVHDVDTQLDAAVIGATTRPLGDGGWAWSRKKSTVNISPLVAVTLAAWGASGAAQNEPRIRSLG